MKTIQNQKRPNWPKIIWNSCSKSSPPSFSPRILGINPWIYDFAAFNLWSRPVGLLTCLQMLRNCGCQVGLLDCMDPTWQDQEWPPVKKNGSGHYHKTLLPRPDILSAVLRQYGRYGLPYEQVASALQQMPQPPDLILVSSIMTYWYPGVTSMLRLLKKIWPRIPVVLGGIYASLCFEHAGRQQADLVLQGGLEKPGNWQQLWQLLKSTAPTIPAKAGLIPALDLYPCPEFAPVMGSRGCPFSCSYCASNKLFSGFIQNKGHDVINMVWSEYLRGVRDFVFYDDALLVKPETWLWPFMDWIQTKKLKLRLHTPNAMHVRYLSQDICKRLKQAGLTTIRLGLESADFESRLDSKLTAEQWEQGVANLQSAGFDKQKIAAYVLFGLPGQQEEQVVRAIEMASKLQIRPELAMYTPIPGSRLFNEACAHSPYPLAEEPVTQNNSIWPCIPGGFDWEKQKFWKNIIRKNMEKYA